MRSPSFFTTALSLLLVIGVFAPASSQAQYPPSIQSPVVGDAIIAPTTPLKANANVFTPIAKAVIIPTLRQVDPVPVRKAISSVGLLKPRSLSTAPAQVTTNISFGGVARKDLANVPVASFRGNRSVEVQTAQDVPTIIEARRLPSNQSARVSFVTSKGKVIDLGSARVNSSGELRLPPITFSKNQVSVTVRVLVGGKTYSYTIRTTN